MKLMVFTLALLVPAALHAQPPSPPPAPQGPVVVTTGEGVVKNAPDRAWVSIAAESRAKSPREAQRVNSEAMSAVLQKIKSLGLAPDAVRTTAYHLQPEFDYANGRQTLRGYLARNVVEVRVDDVARVGEVLESAVGSGATSVGGVRFDLKDRERVEREALRRAVADARARADAAAAGAEMRVAGILRIDEQRAFVPEPRPVMMRQAMEMTAAEAPPIAPGEIEVRVTVTLTASIK